MMLCSLMLQMNILPQSMFRRPVNFYQTTWRHMPEDCYLYSYTCKNLKPFKVMNLYFHKTSYVNLSCSTVSLWLYFTMLSVASKRQHQVAG